MFIIKSLYICRTKVSKEIRRPFTSVGMTLGLAALCRTCAESPGFLKDGGGTLHKTMGLSNVQELLIQQESVVPSKC